MDLPSSDRHGDRAGTHRVPAGLVVWPPDPRSVPVRLGRPVHHVARVQRDAPPGHAGRPARLLPRGLGASDPGRARGDTRPLVRRRPGPPARLAARRRDHPCRARRPPAQRPRRGTVPRGRSRRRHAGRRWRHPVHRRSRRGRSRAIADVTFPIAIGIGVAQALALVPGISRSGISISAGRLAGLDREAAARFAFLMATPITAGRHRLRGSEAPDR